MCYCSNSQSILFPIGASWQLNSIFLIIFVSVIVSKEGPTPSCSRIVALSFSTLCLKISQFYLFLNGGKRRKGYNSAVECHLDVVEVISSSLITPKPNVSFSILMPWSNENGEWIRGSWDWREGGGGYISGSELQANMKRMDTSYALEWKIIPNQLCLRTRKL